MTDDRIKALESIGFAWKTRTVCVDEKLYARTGGKKSEDDEFDNDMISLYLDDILTLV